MRTIKSHLALIILGVLQFIPIACTMNSSSPNKSGNLVSNPDFESNGSPSLAGWKVNDTGWVQIVSNAPSGSKLLSLWLEPSFGPAAGGTATTYITGQSGNGVYNFSCWERNFANWYWGYVLIEQVRNGQVISSRNLNTNDTLWTMFTLADTLDMQASDTLLISLNAPLRLWQKRFQSPR